MSALLRALAHSLTGADVREELHAYLKQRFAAEDVVLFSSGTHALTAAINAALENTADRIVALPAFACYDLATAAIGAEARVALYDVDPETLGPDWESFDAALAQGARAAVVAPLFGYPVDWDRVERAAKRHGAILIEDAAQAAGGQWKGRELGSLGRMSVLSFGRGKGWTGAGGGALLLRGPFRIDPPRPAAPLDSVRAFVHACAQLLLSHPRVYGIPASLPWLHLGETRYKPPTVPRGINRFSAALARTTAQPAEDARAERATRAVTYSAAFENAAGVRTIQVAAGVRPGCLRFPLRVKSAVFRRSVLRSFLVDGVAASYPSPLTTLPDLHGHLLATDDLRGADTLARELVTLPTHYRAPPTLPQRFVAAAAVPAAHANNTQEVSA